MRQDPEERSKRILGTRAFGPRYGKQRLGFRERLRHSTNYVRNTHRQSASRALRTDGGLGFATGLRFDLFELSGVGKLLVEAFLSQGVGQGEGSLRKWLVEWINGERAIACSKRSRPSGLLLTNGKSSEAGCWTQRNTSRPRRGSVSLVRWDGRRQRADNGIHRGNGRVPTA